MPRVIYCPLSEKCTHFRTLATDHIANSKAYYGSKHVPCSGIAPRTVSGNAILYFKIDSVLRYTVSEFM